jgi:hypothetical protein
MRFDADYVRGVEHFNAHEFFEAHEAWEDVWARTSGRDQLFYKGLIHAAVALHHFGNGNLRGARKVWGSCLRYLTPYTPHHLGLDLEAFLARMRACFADLDAAGEPLLSVPLDEAQIPRIALDQSLLTREA